MYFYMLMWVIGYSLFGPCVQYVCVPVLTATWFLETDAEHWPYRGQGKLLPSIGKW